MDKRRRVKFILLIAVSVFAVLFIAAIVIFITGIYSSKVSEILSVQKLYPNTFQTVDVYVDFGNIQVLPSYDANVHLSIYSDSLYNPYGDRTQKEIQDRSDYIVQYLIDKNCKAIVIACNTATAMAVNYLRSKYLGL